MIPDVPRNVLLAAMARFDREMGTRPEASDWADNPKYRYAIQHEGRRYPVKKIISLATGASLSSFTGGNEANSYVKNRGLTVVRLSEADEVIEPAPDALRSNLETILGRYVAARQGESFGKQHELWSVFERLKHALQASDPVKARLHIRVIWSAGKGVWAAVPWISLLDSRETTTTQGGVYCVFLFREDMTGVYLTFNQGVTKPIEEYGRAEGRTFVRANAQALRKGCDALQQRQFQFGEPIELRATSALGEDYEASTIAHKFYGAGVVPEDDDILEDLDAVLAVYEQYVAAKKRAPDIGVPPPSSRIVKIAPGEGARFWDECLQGGYICVGWSEVGDLRRYPSKEQFKDQFRQAFAATHTSESKLTEKANELWTLRELKPGDLVVANQGTTQVLAVGEVLEPGYEWRDNRAEYKHTVRVRWNTDLAKGIPKQSRWAFKTIDEVPRDLYRLILGGGGGDRGHYVEPPFEQLQESVLAEGLRVSERTLRRYHLSLKTRGFVVLSGLSGSGKTWLAQSYARAVSATVLLVPVAPNWTTNEDLLGYYNPLDQQYHDTEFSRFLRDGAAEYEKARSEHRRPRPYHLILDEMNLARVEYYFAKFLSAMEIRARGGTASIELGDGTDVLLPPNLYCTGTVNVDETTHGFADKVYDRAQLIEVEVSREALEEHLGGVPYRKVVMDVWDAVHAASPFAFRVVDEMKGYVRQAVEIGVSWEEALDEQLLQKILPKIKGADTRVGDALERFITLAAEHFPLSHAKAREMLEGFRQHGFASYF